jgi:hypothetical protein
VRRGSAEHSTGPLTCRFAVVRSLPQRPVPPPWTANGPPPRAARPAPHELQFMEDLEQFSSRRRRSSALSKDLKPTTHTVKWEEANFSWALVMWSSTASAASV